MDKVYVELQFSHKSFTTGRIAIVAVETYCEYLTTYKKLATEKVAIELGLDVNEIVVFDYRILGQGVLFIN